MTVETQITAITEKGLDSRNMILCTDDCHSGTLVNDGHMNRVVRHAIDCGCDPLVALQMATINTATHFGLEREIGSLTPGRRADVILTSDLRTLPIETVIARGQIVPEDGVCLDTPSNAREQPPLGTLRGCTEGPDRGGIGVHMAFTWRSPPWNNARTPTRTKLPTCGMP